MADKQVQISATLLEELVICANNVIGMTRPLSDAEKVDVIRLNRALSSASTLLRGYAGPQSFSGSEAGQYVIDPTRSPFL